MERVHVALGSCVRRSFSDCCETAACLDVRVQPCALPIQGDLQVAGVTWKGRRWRFEGRRRACRVAGGVYLTHRGGGTP